MLQRRGKYPDSRRIRARFVVEFRKQAERFGTEFLEEWITKVDLSERPFKLFCDGKVITTDTLIIASGASAKWLGVPGEAKTPLGFGGNGVSACATCDGPLPAFRNKHLVVVGGGDTAMEEATFLTRYASRVFFVHRRDKWGPQRSCRTNFRNERSSFFLEHRTAGDSRYAGTGRHGRHSARHQSGKHASLIATACLSLSSQAQHGSFQRANSTWTKSDTSKHPAIPRPPIFPVFACGDVQDSFTGRQSRLRAPAACRPSMPNAFWNHLPVEMPSGEEVTMEGENISKDHRC